MAQNCQKNLVLKSQSKRSETLLAMLGWFQEQIFSSNFKPYYFAIYEVKVLEIFPMYSQCLSKLTFHHLDF